MKLQSSSNLLHISDWKFTLLESMQKRCLFLDHVAGLTGLSNVNIVCERAEVLLFFFPLRWIVLERFKF